MGVIEHENFIACMYLGDLSQSPVRSINRRTPNEFKKTSASLVESSVYLYAITCIRVNYEKLILPASHVSFELRLGMARISISISTIEGKRKEGKRENNSDFRG